MSVNVEMLELADKVVGMLVNNKEREGLYDHLHMDNWEWPTGVALIVCTRSIKGQIIPNT